MPFEAIYSDYKDAGGAQFPMHIVQKQGGYPIFDLNVTDVKVNAAVDIQPPQGRGGAPAAAAAAPAAPADAAPSEKLGDGVYLITGGYAVIAVDFKDHIALIEIGAERGARAGRHRRSQAADSQQADQVRDQHPQPYRSFRRPARVRRRRLDHPHPSGEQGLSRKGPERAAHAESGQGTANPGRSRWSRRSATRKC